MTVFTVLGSAGVVGAISREYFDKDKKGFASFVTNCLAIIFAVSVLCYLFTVIGHGWIENIFQIPDYILWTILIITLGANLVQVVTVIFQSEQRPVPYGAVFITFCILELVFSLYFVVAEGMNWEGRIYGQTLASFLFIVPLGFILWRKGLLKPDYNKRDVKQALNFGLPLIPHMLAGIMISMTDRLLLSHMIDNHAVGLYAVGAQIGLIISLSVYAFNQAWTPWLFSKLKSNDKTTRYNIVKITYLYCLTVLVGALLYSGIAYYIFLFMIKESYIMAYPVAVIMALSGAFTGMYYMFGGYITYARKTKIHSYITVAVAGVNLLVSYFLIREIGFMGAAIGTLIANIIAFITTAIYACKIYPMPWILWKEQ